MTLQTLLDKIEENTPTWAKVPLKRWDSDKTIDESKFIIHLEKSNIGKGKLDLKTINATMHERLAGMSWLEILNDTVMNRPSLYSTIVQMASPDHALVQTGASYVSDDGGEHFCIESGTETTCIVRFLSHYLSLSCDVKGVTIQTWLVDHVFKEALNNYRKDAKFSKKWRETHIEFGQSELARDQNNTGVKVMNQMVLLVSYQNLPTNQPERLTGPAAIEFLTKS